MNKSVLVIGSGIAGIQASIDLASMGVDVYLVEKATSIGGRMAQLDKTFPTNDCSMCILAPKMLECYGHENVHLLTCSEVVETKSGPDGFRVRVLKKPSFVDENKCTGCGDCVAVCPVEVPDEFNMNLGTRKAIYKSFPQAVPNRYAIDKKGVAPCSAACPARINVQGYIALISQGKFKEAVNLIRQRIPFPAVCGRVCHHPCETQCNRANIDEPLAIASLKRFVADFELSVGSEAPLSLEEKKDEKVAVIGAGPAGLTAAYDLTMLGYGVTVFEALPVAGGMLAVGIPDYRLPKKVLQAEIDFIKNAGVEIRTNTPIGKDLTIADLFQEGYKAVFIGIGAHRNLKLGIPGEDLEGVINGVSLLRDVNLGRKVKIGKRVAIIGGGNVAMDTARTALRLGSKEVLIVYRRSRKEMPANEWEIEQAEEEGIEICYLAAPTRVLSRNGKVAGIECLRMELGEPDSSGRRRPVPIEGSEFILKIDTLIPAIGQAPDLSFLPSGNGFHISKQGALIINPDTGATNQPGIFAGGDAVSGPATAIEAIASGKRAAVAIDRYLRGEELVSETKPEKIVSFEEIEKKAVEKRERQKMPSLNPSERISCFKEAELGFTEEMAINEAKRCLNCAVCSECRECEKACEAKAIAHDMTEEYIDLNVGAIILATGFDLYDPSALEEYGYGKIKNVVTAMQYERMISASGPTSGQLKRPSDGKRPKRLAFIQCVGSRDTRHKPYCSSVCCMHATKEAILANEHYPDLKPFIFYTDLRAVGKRFQEYVTRAKQEYNVTYIRSRPSKITEDPETANPVIWYEDTTTRKIDRMEVDMVVLCQALIPSNGHKDIGDILGLSLSEYGFVYIPDRLFHPVDTEVSGIFACGFCQSPQDIPDSVVQASAAAARAAEFITKGAK